MAGVRRSVFTSDGWQVTLCDPIWQVTLRWGSHEELYRPLPLPLCSTVEYKIEKQREPSVNEVREAVDGAVAGSDTDDNDRKSTTKLLEVENGSSTVVLMMVAVCGGVLITLMLLVLVLVLATTHCRSCPPHTEGPENNDDALCGIYRLLGGVRRQQDKRRTSDHRIGVAIVNESGIGTSTYSVLTTPRTLFVSSV